MLPLHASSSPQSFEMSTWYQCHLASWLQKMMFRSVLSNFESMESVRKCSSSALGILTNWRRKKKKEEALAAPWKAQYLMSQQAGRACCSGGLLCVHQKRCTILRAIHQTMHGADPYPQPLHLKLHNIFHQLFFS